MPRTDAQKRADKKSHAKTQDIISVCMKKADIVNKENIQKWAANAGMSVNKYVITAIFEKAKNDGEDITITNINDVSL